MKMTYEQRKASGVFSYQCIGSGLHSSFNSLVPHGYALVSTD